MVNRVSTSRLYSVTRRLHSEVSHMQIEWKEIEFGPINLWSAGKAR
jgi:hypothetical protein